LKKTIEIRRVNDSRGGAQGGYGKGEQELNNYYIGAGWEDQHDIYNDLELAANTLVPPVLPGIGPL